MARWRVALLVLALLVAAAAGSLAADVPQVVAVQPGVHGEWLTVDLRCGEVFDARSRSTLQSGLPAVVRLDIQLQRQVSQNSLFGRRRSYETVHEVQVVRTLTYDVWDERYVLRVRGQTSVFASLEEASAATREYAGVPLLPLAEVPPETGLRLRARAELVAVSPEHGDRVAAWLRDARDPLAGRRGGAFEFGVHDLLELVWDRRPAAGGRSTWLESPPFQLGADGALAP